MEMRMYFDSDFANDPVKSTLDFGVCYKWRRKIGWVSSTSHSTRSQTWG